MKKLAILFALLGVVSAAHAAVLTHGSVGKGHGVNLPSGDAACPGTLCINYDGSAENGYCWQYGGSAPPYYGAFADCCEGQCVCGVELKLTGIGYPCNVCDIYVWSDAGGYPGSVLCMMSGFNPCPVASWPNISTHDACLNPCCTTNGSFFVGYWANNSAQICGYFVAADTNGFGGCPMTNIAPGIGYPTGWANVSNIWGPTQAIGIGAFVGSGDGCQGGVPVQESTWGQIKNLYN